MPTTTNREYVNSLPDDMRDQLTWLSQHIDETGASLGAIGKALRYDAGTISKVLAGVYTGSMHNVCKRIAVLRKVRDERALSQGTTFVENSIAQKVELVLKYAHANNTITIIVGESRMGKTTAAKWYCYEKYVGTTVYVSLPPACTHRMLLQIIAGKLGLPTNGSTALLYEILRDALTPDMLLVIDEAHFLLAATSRACPRSLEAVRHLHDTTGVGVALIATERFYDSLAASRYQYEQLLGRVAVPVQLKPKIKRSDILPIIKQYYDKPSTEILDHALTIANAPGRLGHLALDLRVASRLAAKKARQLTETDFLTAMAIRDQNRKG